VRKHIVVPATWVNLWHAVAAVWTSVPVVKLTAKRVRINYAHHVAILPWLPTVMKVESISATVVLMIHWICEFT